MEHLRNRPLEGEWWDPARPDIHYKGVLRLGEEHHGTLVLHGTENGLSSLGCDPTPRTFFGILDNQYEVTLFSTGLMHGPSTTFPKKTDKETSAELYTNNVFVGAHVESEEKKFLNGALIHLTGLEEWCDSTEFSGSMTSQRDNEIATESVCVSFQASSSPHYELGDGRLLRILSEYRGPISFGQSKSITLTERNTIELVFSNSISIRELLAEVTIWQIFITLGLRRPSYIDEIVVLEYVEAEKFTRMALMVPGRKPEITQGRRDPRQVLFNRSKLGSKLATCLTSWRKKHDAIELAILLFSGAAYQDDVYTHTNLLAYLQALETLHRESYKLDRFADGESRKATIEAMRAAVPDELGEKLQHEIRMQIGYIGSLTLLDRLNHLHSLYPKCVGPLFRRGEADMALLKDVRNFLTHYGDQKRFGKDFLWSREIFTLKEKARLFLEICLLGEIGMSDDEIFELVDAFAPYRDCRFQTSMDIMNEKLRRGCLGAD